MAQTKAQLIDGKGDAVVNNKLLVGTSSARTNFYNAGVSSPNQIEGTTDQTSSVAIIQNYNAATYGAQLILAKSNALSIGSNTLVASGDACGRVTFQGNDGTDFVEAARIEGVIDGTPGANDMPGRLVFSTTADGASSPTEHMRISQQGAVRMSTNGSYSAAAQDHSMEQHVTDRNIALFYHNGGAGVNPYGISVFYPNQSPNSTGAYFIECRDSGGYRAYMRSNGGLSNYQANNTNLCDEREKKNIEDLDSTWDCLKHWELKKFHYNADSDAEDKKYGVIAQQIQEHCPEVISDWVKQKAEPAKVDDDGNELEPAKEEIVRMGVKEQQMYWMAIKALQEAQVRIEALEAEVAALKAQ